MVFFLDLLAFLGRLIVLSFASLVELFTLKKKSVKGELVLITGAGSGLGRLLSLKFAKLGANLVLWDINEEGVNKVKEEVLALGVRCHAYSCDVSKRENVYKTAKQVQKDAGDVTILINNAGIVTGKTLLEADDNLIEKTFNVNTVAHFWTIKSFLPSMLNNNHGHIVTIASAAGMVGVTGLVDYCASKYGAVGLDESLRMELTKLGKNGVHTTCVCPYYINTGMFDGVQTKYPFLLPILEPNYVTDKIIDAVLYNQQVIALPKIVWTIPLAKGLLSTKACDEAMRWLGISDTMDNFKGRAQEKKTN